MKKLFNTPLKIITGSITAACLLGAAYFRLIAEESDHQQKAIAMCIVGAFLFGIGWMALQVRRVF